MAHPDPSLVSHGPRALMVILVARRRAGIALIGVLPAPERAGPDGLLCFFVVHRRQYHGMGDAARQVREVG